MRSVILYIAMSLDGYIADKHGGVGWLAGDDGDTENMGSYPEFIKTVDTVLLGYNTYRQIVTELSPGNWFYRGMQSYVFTHQQLKDEEEIRFTAQNPMELVRALKQMPGKNIWVCGGAQVVHQLMEEDCIDRYHISMIPSLLGEGIPLFNRRPVENKLKLLFTKSYGGIVDLVYAPRGT